MTNFESLYSAYASQVFKICMGYTNDSDQAQDLLQETFIAVWRNLDSFQNQSKIQHLDFSYCHQQMQVQKRVSYVDLPFQMAEHMVEQDDEKLAVLYQCIASLPEIERIIITLVLEDMPQAEIAQIVGLNEVNIRVRIHRIKEKLSKRMENTWTILMNSKPFAKQEKAYRFHNDQNCKSFSGYAYP
jgi:RNA polymerase sigma-70 factor (ECF subfamily)